MAYKIRCLENKLIEDNKETIRFYLSRSIIKKIKRNGNYFIIVLKDARGCMMRRLGYFEILNVTNKTKIFGGAGGKHRECLLKRLDAV